MIKIPREYRTQGVDVLGARCVDVRAAARGGVGASTSGRRYSCVSAGQARVALISSFSPSSYILLLPPVLHLQLPLLFFCFPRSSGLRALSSPSSS